jgi:LysR family cyn operon transcriptional activator
MHPGVHIKARSGSSENIEEEIIAGVIDLGISALPLDHDEINTAELFTDDILLVVSKQHHLAKKKALEPSDLQMLPVALPSRRIVWTKQLDDYFRQLGVQPKTVVEHDDGNALLEIIKTGDLATLLPKSVVKEDPDLRCWPLPDPGMRSTTVALWTHLSPAAKAFLEIVTNKVRAKI